MNKLKYCLFLIPFLGWGQLTLDVNLAVGERVLILNQPVELKDCSFQLEQARFYLSKFEFYQNGHLVAADPVNAYLVDLELDSTRKLIFQNIDPKKVDGIRFLFGIDSITNTSGAMSGALDPMHGMYWSWQSGYINCKLEGTFIKPKREAFQLHLGGYAFPFSGAQQISLKTNNADGELKVTIDLDLLMQEIIRPQANLHVMSPCIRAVEYAQLLVKSVDLKP
ncbi:MAG: hypothetical protein K0S23_3111 [Fluviicola sp.]|jgi:hypothetical protein|uniref:MbnP family protein n=1 Tax=Fluviicola sp. TaxID=1917219 RepID=UPI00262EE5F9|nr:MbnP family protein [Fluviicola sp.]MDF3028804.1 hypothetical protein [Fluviicola sp.]